LFVTRARKISADFTAPSAATIIATTTAFRSAPSNNDVAPAESSGGIIEKIAAPVYTVVVCAAARASIAEPFGASESTSETPM